MGNHLNELTKTTINQQHTDEPILGSTESPDLLNRERFATQVAETILTVPNSSGFVLSLEGPWGYGKTSILNLISRHYNELPEERRPIVCSFNPWMVGNADTLVQSFLVQLAAAIDLTDNVKSGAKAARELLSYSSIFTALKFIPGAEPWASIVEGVVKTVGTATEKISDLKKFNVEQQRTAVIEALGDLDRRIIVFIDDLDRLPPAEVFAMVRLVKAVGDFSGVVYVLCFEPSYVQETLKTHGIERAEEYLDKVIQTRLTLPQISKDDLVTILNRELDALPCDATKAHFLKIEERHNELYFGGLRTLLETPRDIKRLFNRLRFVESGCRGEVNLADLIALQALALKAPTIFQHIRECPAAYVGKDSRGISIKEPKEIVKSFEGARDKALEMVPGRLQRAVRELLEDLFPLLDENGFGVSTDYAKTRGLISSPDRLDVALSSGLPSGEASYAAAMEFLRNPAIRQQSIESVSESGKLSRFVEHLRFAQKEIEVEDVFSAANIIGKILDAEVGAAVENAQRGIFDSGVCKNSWWLVKAMLEKLPPEQRQMVVTKIILNPESLSLGGHAISELHSQHGAFTDNRALPDENRWVDNETLQEITSKWAQLIVKKVQNGSLFSATKSGMIIYRLNRFSPDALSSVIPEILASDVSFDKFAKAIGYGDGADSIGGKYCHFTVADLEPFGGATKIKSRAAERLQDSGVVGELKYIFTAMISGKKTYLSNGSEGEDF